MLPPTLPYIVTDWTTVTQNALDYQHEIIFPSCLNRFCACSGEVPIKLTHKIRGCYLNISPWFSVMGCVVSAKFCGIAAGVSVPMGTARYPNYKLFSVLT